MARSLQKDMADADQSQEVSNTSHLFQNNDLASCRPFDWQSKTQHCSITFSSISQALEAVGV